MEEQPVVKPKRPRAKKMPTALGPYQTACTSFDGGTRAIEVTLTALGVYYRLKGRPEEYLLPHEAGFLKAVANKCNVIVDPRKGRIKRGGM
jgi:hypothetical protein